MRVLDLGGGPGRYAMWLAQLGYRVKLADLSPELLNLATSVGVAVLAPGHDVEQPDPDSALFGTVEQVASGLPAYEALGVGQVVCQLGPFTGESLLWFGKVFQLFRNG